MNDIPAVVEAIYVSDSRRVFASLVRLLGDFDLAEEALHEAFAMALTQWPEQGVPDNPIAWLVSTGRFQAIDLLRRRGRFNQALPRLVERREEVDRGNSRKGNLEIEDDQLRLIFTCCHPAMDSIVQIPLTLREVCGMSTEEIARAFLVTPKAMAQRLVRGKAKIRDAGIPIALPSADQFPDRLASVLRTIYLIFNEGYSASSGVELIRRELTSEAIRLGRLLLDLLPDPEVLGLLALLLLQESRRQARTTESGDLVLLEDQDRSLWDRQLIQEGEDLIERALSTRRFGSYTLQAAIAAVHADASHPEKTDWRQIVALYDALLVLEPSPVIELNQAVAVAMRDGPEAGLPKIEKLIAQGGLRAYHLAHAAKADLLRRLHRYDEARRAYSEALSLTSQTPEIRFLTMRLQQLPTSVETT